MIKKCSATLALLCASFAFGQTVRPILQPQQVYVDGNGIPCSGCSLFSYSAGTTTPLPTYTDSTGTVQNSNPVIIGVNGIANVWVATTAYKFILKDTSGAVVWSVDNVESPGGGGGGGVPAPPAFAVQLANSGATAFQADPGITINPSTHVLTAPNFALSAPGTPYAAPVFNMNGTISLDSGFNPAPGAAASLQPQTNTLIQQSGTYTTALNMGDSITAANTGGGASVCGLSGGTSGTWTPGSTCYAALVDLGMGISTVLNPAVGGDAIADASYRLFNSSSTPSATQLATIQIGTNDMFAAGAGDPHGIARNFSPAILVSTPDLVSEIGAIEEYMTIKPANWQSGESFCSGGSWTVDTYYAGHHGCKSNTNGDVISSAPFQSALGGEPIAMLYRVFSPSVANGGTFTVELMQSTTGSGGPYTRVNINTIGTTTSTATLFFGNIAGPNNLSTVFSSVFSNSAGIFSSSGLGTSIGIGNWYRLDITITSATDAANVVSILGAGFGNSWLGDSSAYPVQFWRLNIPDTRGAQQFGVWNQLNADLNRATQANQASGFTVNLIDSHNWLTGKWANYVPSNFHHPNDSGHRLLANAALYSQTARIQSIIAPATPQALNANGGTITGTVALGNASTAMQFNDNSGQVVMAVRNGIWGTGMLGQFDATKTACQTGGCGTAYPPTALNQFVGPGPNGNGHYLDRIIAWYDSGASAIYAQAWKESFFAAATPTPTAFQWTFSCSVVTPLGGGTAGACLPFTEVHNYPTTSTVAYTGLQSLTLDGRLITSKAGAVSAPAFSMTGLPFTGGSATGTVPLAYLNQGTAPTTWSTAGTEFGINAPSGFAGNFVDYHLNGGTSLYKVDNAGNIVGAGSLTLATARKGTFTCTGGGTITVSNTNETATSDVIISLNTAGGTITTPPAMKTVTAATGFTVLCGATDTSTYGYNILN